MKALVLDAFMYNGEPIVEMRLELLYPYVDRFIITESIYTHSGEPKDDLYFRKNFETVFKPYSDKVSLVVVNTLPSDDNIPEWIKTNQSLIDKQSWWKESFQRDSISEYIKREFRNVPFILICSDVDEIVNPMLLQNSQELYNNLQDNILHIGMQFYYYNFDWIVPEPWYQSFIITDKLHGKFPLSQLRRSFTVLPAEKVAVVDPTQGGWHCSYFMSVSDVSRKLRSFAHTEYSHITDLTETIRDAIGNGKDLFLRSYYTLTKRDHETNMPSLWAKYDAKIKALQH